ncbi:MAG: flagellar basal body-associated protein FliL [Pseudodesulfovibrio sp.]|jgi:flagellar FliL protein|uniref:Flagellar protein FliL n=1 Tax=Pseudodesulfovibrio indicus TaxID=1716143 RepID=A0A126QPE1_9BACT|nr:flagellar basal body-associated FliL family protein [Pseudodesulfovibrio indicus]AMK11617.1 flagellar basal body protein FliL [Pseudodesulfovibrio indicus]TDT90025.1 flagellar FliL protein [Pseudodesulfovibrio indicus]
MVLLVPDDSEEVTAPASEQRKAQLDDAEASRATQKVDLDLDDAPFLEDEDEEEEIEEVEVETSLLKEEPRESKPGLAALLRNKVVLISLGVILILLVVIVILLLREPEAPPAPPPPPVEETVPEEEAPPAVEETPSIVIKLDPFFIEQRDSEGVVRFLEVSILVSTEDDGLARQFKQDVYTIRNALFYYLKNKDLQFLTDKENSDKLKKELLAIINQYMGFGQFDTLLFEQYLVR